MKKYWFCEKPAILVEAENAQRKLHPVLLVVFYLLFGSFLMNYLISFTVTSYLPPYASGYMEKSMILTNILYVIPFSLFLFFVRFVEKRSWSSIGIVRNKIMDMYLTLTLIFVVVAWMLILYFVNDKYIDSEVNASLMALGLIALVINNFCHAIAAYGFLLVSLVNRMSMKKAILVAVLIPSLVFLITDIISIDWDLAINGGELVFRFMIKSIVAVIFMASCALLLLRTSHIWGVAILTLLWSLILDVIPFYYTQIIAFIVAAAILCAVLFWPKKTLVNQEGAGVVSQ